MRKSPWKTVLGLAVMLPAAAFAQQTAYTNATVNMRAGPNAEFPLVATIYAGAPVYVNGCVAGYTWCDVSAGPDRGWIYADYLSYPYRNQPVTIISGGAAIGLPIVTFAVGNYWDSYYRARPWYGSRAHYYNRPANWWYRPAPRYYAQPVVRTYPGGRWDNDRRWHDDRRYDGGHWDNNNRGRHDNRPRQDNRARGSGESTLSELERGRVTTGENQQTSRSHRTYSQQ